MAGSGAVMSGRAGKCVDSREDDGPETAGQVRTIQSRVTMVHKATIATIFGSGSNNSGSEWRRRRPKIVQLTPEN